MSVEKIERPHWLLRCDECGDPTGADDYGGWILYEAETEAKAAADEWGWRIADDGRVTCEACLEEERLEAEAERLEGP